MQWECAQWQVPVELTPRRRRRGDAYAAPARAGLMQNLVSLELQGNSLQGALPASLAALPGLKLLDASNNALAGPLPGDWGGASQLTLLMLPGNMLTGQPLGCPCPVIHPAQGLLCPSGIV